jgi:outer membrane receptor for Fe3+-dicitrate
MKLGETSQTVEVTGAAPLVQLTSSTLAGQVESQTVLDLPLNGRDWTALATLHPGVNLIETQMDYATSARGNRGFGAELTISGQRTTNNNYRLDGISVNDYANSGPGNVLGAALGVDAIQEFSVLTGSFSAEYGKASGGVINAITKSGTNAFHGDVYEFIRNSALDSRDYFSRSGNTPLAQFRRNQFGAAAGGPIIKGKTFIFGDYEGLRQAKGITTAILSLLTARGRGT